MKITEAQMQEWVDEWFFLGNRRKDKGLPSLAKFLCDKLEDWCKC